MFSWLKKIFLTFLLGALAFTPWDILMVKLHIVEYPYPTFWGITWWTPLAFGMVTSGGYIFYSIADKLFHTRVDYNPNFLALEYLLLSGFYVAVLFFRQYPYLLSLSLLFIVLLRIILFHHAWDLVFFIFGACLGPTVELILTSLHLYLFTEPDFLGMPFWLPVIWGNVSLAMRRVTWILEPPKIKEGDFEVPLSEF